MLRRVSKICKQMEKEPNNFELWFKTKRRYEHLSKKSRDVGTITCDCQEDVKHLQAILEPYETECRTEATRCWQNARTTTMHVAG